MDNKKVVLDTNILLDSPYLIQEYDCVLLSHTLRELDKHKISHNFELAYKAREAVRYIEKNIDRVTFDLKDYPSIDGYDEGYQDNRILKACLDNGYALASRDLLIKQKARGFNIEVIDVDALLAEDEYCGFIEVEMNEKQMAYFYENIDVNTYDVLTNQYLMVKNNEGHIVDTLKWNGERFVKLTEKNLSTVMLGKFKPMDQYQKAAIDSLLNNDITLLRGKAGSGKSLIALNYALHQLEKGKIGRIVCLVNPVPVRGAQEIGFYKGDKNQKLLQSGIGNILISKIGDIQKVEAMIAVGEIVLIPFVDIRGYDTGSDSLVWVTESQNLSVDLLKLGLQRIGKGSQIIIDGDDKAQVDNSLFAGANSGIKRMSKIFRGESVYGEVEFKTIYRSEIASIADRM
jgi:predicted ribonuclease YlaK